MYKIILTILINILLLFSVNARADDIKTAYNVCKMVDSTEVMSAPCKVSTNKRAVTLIAVTNASAAMDVCILVSLYSNDKGFIFDKPWKIVITSPDSNGKQIASCPLPTRSR